MRWLLLLLVCSCAMSAERSSSQPSAFKRQNPCPFTGERKGSCPGFVIDHVHPLCAGGADRPVNMQWQARAESYKKDADERRLCRAMKSRRSDSLPLD